MFLFAAPDTNSGARKTQNPNQKLVREVLQALQGFTGGKLISMMLAVSLVLGILPLLGIVWTLTNGLISTVDGMFLSLILLTLSAVFLLNAYWEMRDLGMLGSKKTTASAKSPAAKAS
jgi:hypothetical protein